MNKSKNIAKNFLLNNLSLLRFKSVQEWKVGSKSIILIFVGVVGLKIF